VSLTLITIVLIFRFALTIIAWWSLQNAIHQMMMSIKYKIVH